LDARGARVRGALVSLAHMALQLRAAVDGRVQTSTRELGARVDGCLALLLRELLELQRGDHAASQPAMLLSALDFNGFYQSDLSMSDVTHVG
jgi:hypothetical protein